MPSLPRSRLFMLQSSPHLTRLPHSARQTSKTPQRQTRLPRLTTESTAHGQLLRRTSPRMSAPPGQGSQNPPPQQPPQQQQRQQQQISILKPEDLARMTCLNEDQKQKYFPLLNNFWTMYKDKAPGSIEHTQAYTKLRDWSMKLIAQEREHRKKTQPANGQGQPAQPGQASRPQNVPQQQQQPQPPSQSAQPGPPQANRPAGVAPNSHQPSPEVLKHVNEFPYQLPPGGPPLGSPEADLKLKEMRVNYLTILNKQEKTKSHLSTLNNALRQREAAGQPAPPELLAQKASVEATFNTTKRFVEEFRKKQVENKAANEQRAAAQRQQGSPPQALPQAPVQQAQAQAQPQSQPPPQNAVKSEPQIKMENGQPQPQPTQFGNMQGGGAAQQQQNQQNQQNQPVPASSMAQQQSRPLPAPHSQTMSQVPQPNQTPYAQPGQQAHPRPQINPQQANAHMQQQNNSPHPQSATMNAAGHPVPLSHQAAMTAVNRSYSHAEPQRTGSMQAQGNFHAPGSREREQMNNPKMPIPRQLNVTSPVPVQMQQARPTMGGPTNGAPGPMSQPVINKFPPFQLEGDGDRVLSKRKLDELVRQVTGGSEDALTPEVEEVSHLRP
jgi:transcription initiation factor TFIID subunit 12